MKDNKIFVFLSHSHHDYEKVRLVRDLLENKGFRPLMFFLKCLDKKGFEEFTKMLIREEIDSRQRFILCRSLNAAKSDWVKFEVDHIKKTNRPYEIIDLDWTTDLIEEAINRFQIRSTVFISYPRRLRELAVWVNEQLTLCDFCTYPDWHNISTDSFHQNITQNIQLAAKRGYVLVLIDETFQEETFQHKELLYAMDLKSRIVPVITTKNVPETAKRAIADLQWIDVSGMNNTEATEHIVQELIKYDIRLCQR